MTPDVQGCRRGMRPPQHTRAAHTHTLILTLASTRSLTQHIPHIFTFFTINKTCNCFSAFGSCFCERESERESEKAAWKPGVRGALAASHTLAARLLLLLPPPSSLASSHHMHGLPVPGIPKSVEGKGRKKRDRERERESIAREGKKGKERGRERKGGRNPMIRWHEQQPRDACCRRRRRRGRLRRRKREAGAGDPGKWLLVHGFFHHKSIKKCC